MGDELDPIAWIQRDPDGWSEQRKEKHPKKLIKIGVNLVTPASFDAEKLMYRGAAAVAMTDVLEQMGHRVELVAFWAVSHLWGPRRGTRHVIKTVVKAGDAPLNMNAVTVAMVEIAFSRVVMMPAIARSTARTPAAGMGRCMSLRSGDKAGLDLVIDQDVVTMDQAVDAVRLAMANVTKDTADVDWGGEHGRF
jgi:hypothetical protein